MSSIVVTQYGPSTSVKLPASRSQATHLNEDRRKVKRRLKSHLGFENAVESSTLDVKLVGVRAIDLTLRFDNAAGDDSTSVTRGRTRRSSLGARYLPRLDGNAFAKCSRARDTLAPTTPHRFKRITDDLTFHPLPRAKFSRMFVAKHF